MPPRVAPQQVIVIPIPNAKLAPDAKQVRCSVHPSCTLLSCHMQHIHNVHIIKQQTTIACFGRSQRVLDLIACCCYSFSSFPGALLEPPAGALSLPADAA